MKILKFILCNAFLLSCNICFANNKTDSSGMKFISIEIKGGTEKLTDQVIESLISILQPRDMDIMNSLIDEVSIKLNSLDKNSQDSILAQGKYIMNLESKPYLMNSKDPRYALPVVNVGDNEYLALNRSDFSNSSFDSLIPMTVFKEHPYWSNWHNRLSFIEKNGYSFAAISPIPFEDIHLIMSDLCRTESSYRTFGTLYLHINTAAAGTKIQLDYETFKAWRNCDF